MRADSRPWLWLAGAIVVAGVLISATVVFVNRSSQPDCSKWDRAVDMADEVWTRYIDAQVAKYGVIGDTDTVALWERSRDDILALAAKTGIVPSSPDPIRMETAIIANEAGVEDGWLPKAGPFLNRPGGC